MNALIFTIIASTAAATVPSLHAQADVHAASRHGAPSAAVQTLLAHRDELALDAEQVRHLEALSADLRRQDADWYPAAQRRLSSKPWLHGTEASVVEQARASAFRVLRPDQRERARCSRDAATGRAEGAARAAEPPPAGPVAAVRLPWLPCSR